MASDAPAFVLFLAQRSIRLLAAMLALTLLAGCASGASNQTATATPSAPTVTATVNPYDVTPTPGPFVCANPAGSGARYAYVAADHQLTLVQGCSPKEVSARPNRTLVPWAFSPSGQWLLAGEASTLNPDSGSSESLCETLINGATGSTTLTLLCNPSITNTAMGWIGFIGWSDDSTCYEGEWATGTDNAVTVMRVTLPTMTATKITTFPWVANLANTRTSSGIVLRGGALYYAGYASASDHEHAWLRRYDLATGANTRIVSLGIAGTGGCQVQVDNTPCAWAGPWDISTDGSKIAYHIPGPTQSITDTFIEKNAPLYIARSDGSGAARLFPDVPLGNGFNSPVFSPDGRYLEASFYTQAAQTTNLFIERLNNASLIQAQGINYFLGWASQPGVAIVLLQPQASNVYVLPTALYNVETQALTRLQAGSYQYIWA